MISVGHGYDSHRFKDGDFILLGGVKISSTRSIVAHSDGDILAHAICDALLGASGKGDLGKYFDSSDKYKGMDSTIFLKHINETIIKDGFRIINIDATVVTERPRISKYSKTIEDSLCNILGIKENQINIKSKTNDKLGYIGREEGIEAHVVLLLEKK